MIAMPCIVNVSHISTFLCTTSYTCISQLFCITYNVKVMNILKQDVWFSSYKHVVPFWPHILRTIQPQHSDCTFRCPSLFSLIISFSIKYDFAQGYYERWRYFLWAIWRYAASVVKWLACWPLVPKIAGSILAEAVGFFGRKTLHEDRYTFLTIASIILLRTRNISDKSYRENQNHFYI